MSLPDDVSIRTSNEHGKSVRALWGYWREWNCLCGVLQDGSGPSNALPIAHVAGNAADEFQASIYCSITGYYRAAFSCLRNVIEQMTVGLQLELSRDLALFRDWLNGQEELGLGWAADLLPKNAAVADLETWYRSKLGDDLFSQKKVYGPHGGFVRRLFSQLSQFTHGAPGYTDFDIRQSNGPIFVREAYADWVGKFRQVYAVGMLEAQIARPGTHALAFGSRLTSRNLFEAILTEIPVNTEGRELLASMRPALWS